MAIEAQTEAIQAALKAFEGQPLEPLVAKLTTSREIVNLGRALVNAKKGTMFGRLLRGLNMQFPIPEDADLRTYMGQVAERYPDTAELQRIPYLGPKSVELLALLYPHFGISTDTAAE